VTAGQKEPAAARGNCTEAALIQTPDGDMGVLPIGASPKHWNNPVRVNTSRARGKSSKRSVLISESECDSPSHQLVGVTRAFGVLVGHSPSAILSLPAFVSRSPPDNSCMYPSWINRSLCSAGIVRCIKPLAQSRNETNSSWVNGADKSGFIFQICASGAAVQASHPATIKLTHYRAFRLDV
jgi:hypothetical protein